MARDVPHPLGGLGGPSENPCGGLISCPGERLPGVSDSLRQLSNGDGPYGHDRSRDPGSAAEHGQFHHPRLSSPRPCAETDPGATRYMQRVFFRSFLLPLRAGIRFEELSIFFIPFQSA